MLPSRSEPASAGQRGALSEPTATPDPRHPQRASTKFAMVLRGYDWIQVDDYVQRLLEENAALRRDLSAAPGVLRDPAGTPRPRPSPTARSRPSPTPQGYNANTPAQASWGFRAEQLLRRAEREAAEIRTRATRNAEAREAFAQQSAKEQLRVARKQAETIRSRASEEAARAKKQASQEAARAGHVYRKMKGELRRLAEQLNADVQRLDQDRAPASADEPNSGTASRGGAGANATTGASTEQ